MATTRSRPRQPVLNAFAHSLLRSPWAITDQGKEMLLRAAMTQLPDPSSIEKERGTRLDESCPGVTLKHGIATIRVVGPLFRYENFYSYWFGWSTYEQLAYLTTEIRRRTDVKQLLFDFDTPGGEVNGISECARILFDGREEKGQAGFASGLCCSGGYWLASAVGSIAASRVSILGSIGVMSTFYDDTEFLKMWGFKKHTVRASQSPRKNLEPTSREGEADWQKTIDDLCAVFIKDVSDFRNVSEEIVLSEYGEGGVMVGAAAVDAGLADQLTTYEGLHAELVRAADAVLPTPKAGAGASATVSNSSGGRPNTSKSETAMADKSKPGGGATAPVVEEKDDEKDEEMETEEHDEEEEEEEEEETTASAASTDPVAKERARVKGIVALQRTASEKAIIDACIDDPTCSIADAALKLRQAESSSRGSRVDALRREEAGVRTPAAQAGAGTEASDVEKLSDAIANAGKPAPKAQAS